VPVSLSILADQVGGCTAALMPLFKRLEAYVLSAVRLHGDDTRVPVLAKGKTGSSEPPLSSMKSTSAQPPDRVPRSERTGAARHRDA
jgi:Transposase IS66 family